MQPKPVRLQRSRAKGSRLVSPNGLPVVCVTRPGPWGNPFKSGVFCDFRNRAMTPRDAVFDFRLMILQTAFPELRRKAREELGGKNLACYCDLNDVCHTDVLLIVANSTEADLDNPDSDAWKALHNMKGIDHA